MTRIYTRSGDNGTTGLADGSRIDKDSLRVDLIGTLDELNAYLGMILLHPLHSPLSTMLIPIQHRLFDLGGEIAKSPLFSISADDVLQLEAHIDQLQKSVPELKQFILPGGNTESAQLHLARTVCRHAERLAVSLNKQETLNHQILQYLNRLSDLLFVAARYATIMKQNNEIYWQKQT